MTRCFIICTLYHFFYGDQIKKGETERACGMNRRDGKCTRSFGQETRRKEIARIELNARDGS
jgi:hypothetical protein